MDQDKACYIKKKVCCSVQPFEGLIDKTLSKFLVFTSLQETDIR